MKVSLAHQIYTIDSHQTQSYSYLITEGPTLIIKYSDRAYL